MDYFATYPLRWLAVLDVSHHLVQEILEDPNKRDYLGYTPLHAAAQCPDDHPRFVQLLLDYGADVNSASPSGYTPLHLAVCTRKRYLVDVLIEAGASVNTKDYMGRTALHYAISKRWSILDLNIACDIWIVERLLREPEIYPNPVDHRGQTPLMWAVKEWHQDAVKLLLKNGANPNIPNYQNRTPLHEALSARNRSSDIVFSLLTNGAGIYCADNWGQTPVNILIRLVRDPDTVLFGLQCFRLIVLRYHITETFMRRLESFPALHFRVACWSKEVRLMNSVTVYEGFTLHDFALDCYPSRVQDPKAEICVPVVELLLSEYIVEYFELILVRISKQDLREMLERISDHPVPPDTSHLDMLKAIRLLYLAKEKLKKRLCLLKETLASFYDQKLAFRALRNYSKLFR